MQHTGMVIQNSIGEKGAKLTKSPLPFTPSVVLIQNKLSPVIADAERHSRTSGVLLGDPIKLPTISLIQEGGNGEFLRPPEQVPLSSVSCDAIKNLEICSPFFRVVKCHPRKWDLHPNFCALLLKCD